MVGRWGRWPLRWTGRHGDGLAEVGFRQCGKGGDRVEQMLGGMVCKWEDVVVPFKAWAVGLLQIVRREAGEHQRLQEK